MSKKLLLKKYHTSSASSLEDSNTPTPLTPSGSTSSLVVETSSTGTPGGKLMHKMQRMQQGYSPANIAKSFSGNSLNSASLDPVDVEVVDTTNVTIQMDSLYSARSRVSDGSDDEEEEDVDQVLAELDNGEKYSYRQAALENVELYCYCRKPYDAGVFMICCDECEEWYHGKCVGISEKKAADITHYVCPECMKKKPMGAKGTVVTKTQNAMETEGSGTSVAAALKKQKEKEKKEAAKRAKRKREQEAKLKKKEEKERKQASLLAKKQQKKKRKKPTVADDSDDSDDDYTKGETLIPSKKQKTATITKKKPAAPVSTAASSSSMDLQASKLFDELGAKPDVRYVEFDFPDPFARSHETGAKRIVAAGKGTMMQRRCGSEECENTARIGSKYCSDYCGVKVQQDFLINKLGSKTIKREWLRDMSNVDKSSNILEDALKRKDPLYARVVEFQQRNEKAKKALETNKVQQHKLMEAIDRVWKLADEEEGQESASNDGMTTSNMSLDCPSCGSSVRTHLINSHMISCQQKRDKDIVE